MKKLISISLLSGLLVNAPVYAETDTIYTGSTPVYTESDEMFNRSRSRTTAIRADYNPYFVPFDVLLFRPLGLVTTIAGSALFVATSPLTALSAIAPPHDAFEQMIDIFIIVPSTYTFYRPLGKFLCPGDCRPADIKAAELRNDKRYVPYESYGVDMTPNVNKTNKIYDESSSYDNYNGVEPGTRKYDGSDRANGFNKSAGYEKYNGNDINNGFNKGEPAKVVY